MLSFSKAVAVAVDLILKCRYTLHFSFCVYSQRKVSNSRVHFVIANSVFAEHTFGGTRGQNSGLWVSAPGQFNNFHWYWIMSYALGSMCHMTSLHDVSLQFPQLVEIAREWLCSISMFMLRKSSLETCLLFQQPALEIISYSSECIVHLCLSRNV